MRLGNGHPGVLAQGHLGMRLRWQCCPVEGAGCSWEAILEVLLAWSGSGGRRHCPAVGMRQAGVEPQGVEDKHRVELGTPSSPRRSQAGPSPSWPRFLVRLSGPAWPLGWPTGLSRQPEPGSRQPWACSCAPEAPSCHGHLCQAPATCQVPSDAGIRGALPRLLPPRDADRQKHEIGGAV